MTMVDMPFPPASPFLERLLAFLIPFFTGFTADIAAARAEALETLGSYGARTRAELICAVQIIVFSFAALETMAQAAAPDISPNMRIRYRGCANNLNRGSQKTEQILARRLACDPPTATSAQAEPVNDLSDSQAQDMLRQTQAAIDDHRSRASANRSTPIHPSQVHPAQTHPAQIHPGQTPANAILPGQRPGSASHLHPTGQSGARLPRSMGPFVPKQPSPPGQNLSVLLTQEEKNKRLWGAAMMETLAQMGMPVKPAIPATARPTPGA